MERKQGSIGTYKLERAKVRTGQDMERKQASIGTYKLERAKVRTGQDMERKQASNRYLLSGEGKGQDWSGHGKKTS